MTPRRLGGVLVTVLAIGLYVSGAAFSRASAPAELVAIRYESNAASLVRVNPVSLERVGDSAVPLPRDAGGLMLSPGGTQLAFGSNGTTSIHLYDLTQMQARSSFEIARGPGSVWVLAWPKADRLLALVHSCCSKRALLESVDPQTGRVLSRRSIKGDVRDAAQTPGGVVLLVARVNAIAPARLALVDAEGALRWVTVARVQVGFKPKPTVARGRQAQPGLAVDAAGRRVFLVPANRPIAEVGMEDLSVSYHATRRLTVVEKEFRGPFRFAEYVGDGLLAVSGFDGVRSASGFSFVPAGLMLIDTHDWSERIVDGAPSWFTFAPPYLLFVEGHEFLAYSTQGQLRFQLHVDQPLGSLTAIGSYAYVWEDNRTDVIDLSSGALVNTTAPQSLTPIAVAPQL